jgi:DNA polymerase I-like protein with 3'-5' exonuclease and polymerase domains
VKVPRYWDRTIQQVKQQGYAETLAGRRVQVVGDWSGKDGWQMESTAIIYPIQGTGADQKYLAFKVLKDYIININAYFAWDLHDGIYLYVPDDKVEQAAVEITRLLNNLPYREAWDFTPSIPLPWDCKYGPGWGGLKEWKGA